MTHKKYVRYKTNNISQRPVLKNSAVIISCLHCICRYSKSISGFICLVALCTVYFNLFFNEGFWLSKAIMRMLSIKVP